MVKNFFYSLVAVLFFSQSACLQASEEAKTFIKDLGARAIDS